MIIMQRLTEDCFRFEGAEYCRRFPFEYLIALNEDEVRVLAYAKIDVMKNELLELVGPDILQKDLRKLAIFLFEEMGEQVMIDITRGLPNRIDLGNGV